MIFTVSKRSKFKPGLRKERDKTLPAPKLMIPSIQVNIRAGKMPPEENNGVTYLKVPIKLGKTK